MSPVLPLAVVLQLAGTPACTAPGVPPANVAAVARQESGYHPYAIRDETTDSSHYPATRDEAETLATRLTAQGHLLGVGLMQLTPPAHFGLSIAQALDPCTNMRAGAELLAANFKLEWQALMGALGRYNVGDCSRLSGAGASRCQNRASAYSKRIVDQAHRMPSLAAVTVAVDAPAKPTPAAAPKPRPCAPSWDVWAVCRAPKSPQGDLVGIKSPLPSEINSPDAPAEEAAADAPVQCAASERIDDEHQVSACGGRFVAGRNVTVA